MTLLLNSGNLRPSEARSLGCHSTFGQEILRPSLNHTGTLYTDIVVTLQYVGLSLKASFPIPKQFGLSTHAVGIKRGVWPWGTHWPWGNRWPVGKASELIIVRRFKELLPVGHGPDGCCRASPWPGGFLVAVLNGHRRRRWLSRNLFLFVFGNFVEWVKMKR